VTSRAPWPPWCNSRNPRVMLTSLVLLLAIQLAGEITVRCLNLPLPGPVVGLLFLLCILGMRRGVSERLRLTSEMMLQNLTLLVVPATVGVAFQMDRVVAEWRPILLATIAGTALTMAVAALTLHLLLRRGREPIP
jgi:holin-like protein